ncbi:hypothetical protein ANN_20774 [Periplaneta americana]|uniref:Attractin n=1 Tax=Periplaneta americana TaxID=6978 RepID=A0ABQ8SE02_PERAM|nr:hypothetical protein ANN_20774 [Periplaneta americana]
MYKDGYSIRRIPEVVAHSGSALLHFYSDVVYSMAGFNISYRMNSCPSRYSQINCSGNGVCTDGYCTCDSSYMGEACDVPVCPNNCSNGHGFCNSETHRCDCEEGYKGDDCGQLAYLGYWEIIQTEDFVPEGSASHGAVVWQDSLYIISGESYGKADMMSTYDFYGNVWEEVEPESDSYPTKRYGHTTVVYDDKIYLYGGLEENGVISNELWTFNISTKTWENITVRFQHCMSVDRKFCGPLRSAGHSAVLITNGTNGTSDQMVVIFGFSPEFGYLNTVQEFELNTGRWQVVATRGFPVKGSYGHSAEWDPFTQKIYVYGGVEPDGLSTTSRNKLLSYEPFSHTWTLLPSAPSARFLHSASFVTGGLMVVFGGNTHKDNDEGKCYSSDILAYDVTCGNWNTLSVPQGLRSDLARFGHSATIFENSLYIYGGFDGQMLSDMLRFSPGNCSALSDRTSCLETYPGVKCVWNNQEDKCLPITELSGEEDVFSRCAQKSRSVIVAYEKMCSELSDCASCSNTAFQCMWCGSAGCKFRSCRGTTINNEATVENAEDQLCADTESSRCRQLYKCQACTTHNCTWDFGTLSCKSRQNLTSEKKVRQCVTSCAEFTSCLTCTEEDCLWCQNEGRCVDKIAYITSFPYGQCREWTAHQARCRPTYACECNGLAECHPETGKCFCSIKGVTGDHCERCDEKNNYFGDPTTGSCFYDLTTDYEFTFNMTKSYYTQIKYTNTPSKPDIDVDVLIKCTEMAKFNISVKTGNESEKTLFEDYNCTWFSTTFSKLEFIFGIKHNLTTFYVYMYDMHSPMAVQISFAQYPHGSRPNRNRT